MKYNVMSLMKTDVKYHTNGKCGGIKAKTTTEVDSDVVKPEKIKACYGNRVRIIENWDNFDTDLEVVAETKDETKEPVKDEVKKPQGNKTQGNKAGNNKNKTDKK